MSEATCRLISFTFCHIIKNGEKIMTNLSLYFSYNRDSKRFVIFSKSLKVAPVVESIPLTCRSVGHITFLRFYLKSNRTTQNSEGN